MRRLKPWKTGLLCLLLALTCACDQGQNKEEEVKVPVEKQYTGVRLVQVDSIMIDVMGAFRVYDYQPETDLFLAGDISRLFTIGGGPRQNLLGHMVLNRQGKVLHQFNHANNGPEGHGGGAAGNFFLGPDKIGVMGMKALYQYGLDGSFQKKYTGIDLLDRVGITNRRAYFSADGQYVALGIPKGMEAAKAAWDSLFQIAKPLWFYDLNEAGADEEAGLLSVHGYPDHPIYAPDSKINHTSFPPLMALDHQKNQLLTVYPEIETVSRYDLKTGALVGEWELEPDHFVIETEVGKASGGIAGYESLLWLNKGGRMANSKYHDIIQLGEYTLLRYNVALPGRIVKQLVAGKGVRKDPDWPALRARHYFFYYQLLKDGKKVLPDFKLPGLEPGVGDREVTAHQLIKGEIIGGNGLNEIFIFEPNTGAEERDYELIRVFKLELIQE